MKESIKKSKVIGSLLGIFGFIALVAGATYAWLTWRSNNIIIAGSTECFDVVYYRKDLGTVENPAILKFMTNYNRDNLNQVVANPEYAEVGLSLDPRCTNVAGLGKLYLTTNVSTDDILLTGGLYYTLVKVENSTETFIKDGPITTEGDMLLQDNIFVSSTTGGVKYRVYLWINGPITTDQNYVGASYIGEIRAEVVSQEDTTPPVNAAEYIRNLYTSADKSTATVNNITYNLAPSVNLMNDRHASMSTGADAGDIRFYGANPNNYVDIGHRNTKPWEKWNMFKGMFENSQQCYATADCETNYAMIGQLIDMNFTSAAQCEAAMPSILANAGVSSIDEICGEQPILYRIIGVFGGRLKLVTADSIGSYSWDTSDESINSGYGINQWGPSNSYEGADLMRLLNPGYEGENVNNSLYWNSGSGSCYNGLENATTECDFTGSGLSTNVQNMIDTVTWYTGAYDQFSYVDAHYSAERGSMSGKALCTQGTSYCDDTVTRTNTWNGKVGLISASDYGYAADLAQCNQTLDNYSSCTSSNWLFIGRFEWTMSPRAYSGIAYAGFHVFGGGDLSTGLVGDGTVVRPAVYLKSGVTIDTEGRDGSQSNPYVLSY